MINELETSRDARRLKALHRLDILDSLPEVEFDEIVELAATICGVPIGLISVVDRQREWFKAAVGLTIREIPIKDSFCAYAIQQDDAFVVADATKDARFASNSLVTGELGIRFYAGFPLNVHGCVLGTLCVLDVVPRALTVEQTKALKTLMHQVEARLEMRSQRLALETSLRDQEKLANSLRSSEAVFRAFMNNSPHLNYIKDSDGRMVFYNAAFAEQLGVSMEECLGKLDHELWPAEQASVFRLHDLEVLNGGIRVEYDEEISRFGRLMHFQSTKFPYEDGHGNRFLAGISIDMTEEMERKADLVRYQRELETANFELRQLSVTDALTGMKNRRAFDERLMIEFALARRVGRDLSVILIDVDNFKIINDRLGHAGGDRVLREMSRLLERTVRLADLAVRYGGEEFAVLLPDSNVAQAMRCAERFRAALKYERFEHGPVTVSMGVAGIADGENGSSLVRCADEALYAAKRGGKDTIVTYSRSVVGTALSGFAREATGSATCRLPEPV